MNVKDIAAKFYKEERLKRRREIYGTHQRGFYVGGQPIEQGVTKANAKKRAVEKHKKGIGGGLKSGYMNK